MITLTKDMEVGVPKIDSQHKELVDRINAVTAMGTKSATDEETKKTLNFLGEYVVKHFRDEEELHKQSNYPKMAEHKEQHKQFLKAFDDLKNEFLKSGSSAKLTLEINNSAITWVVRHIKSSDKDFGTFYNS